MRMCVSTSLGLEFDLGFGPGLYMPAHIEAPEADPESSRTPRWPCLTSSRELRPGSSLDPGLTWRSLGRR